MPDYHQQPKPRILLTDDQQIVLDSLEAALVPNYEVLKARSAAAALAILRKEKVDLVVLDVNLGQDNGLLLCDELRTSAATKNLPIIILTGLGKLEIKELAFISGADDFVEKTAPISEILARIESKLRRSRDARAS
jgi:DNA-binding response OmpR family regulator